VDKIDTQEMSNRPIGVFDSGVGGLTVVRALERILPREEVIYFGDTARVPYGIKSAPTIRRFSIENARFLARFKIKLLIVACNSSSAFALSELRKRFDFPVLGVINPTVEKAVRLARKKIGIIATPATIRSGVYQDSIQRAGRREKRQIEVFAQECPLFVPLVEEGWLEGKISRQIAQRYLNKLKNRIEVLILGCTHYPLLKKVIRKVIGEKVILIDSATEPARAARDILRKEGLLSSSHKGKTIFYVSDFPERFKEIGRRFLNKDIEEVRCIRLE